MECNVSCVTIMRVHWVIPLISVCYINPLLLFFRCEQYADEYNVIESEVLLFKGRN